MLGMDAVPAILYFFLLFAVPESPRWLFGQGETEQAKVILIKACGTEEAEKEMVNVRQSFGEKTSQVRVDGLFNRVISFIKVKIGPLFSRRMSFIMFIALAIAFFQQITGINADFLLSADDFYASGRRNQCRISAGGSGGLG